jgi:hypothetical protein
LVDIYKHNSGDVRLTGAWVSLNTLEDFEARLRLKQSEGVEVEEDEKEEDVLRESLKDVISDIEWGVLSGLFEFTVINDDPTRALSELKQAASYLALDGEFEGADDLAALRPPGV